MASELHTLIEEELKNKNYKNDEEKALMGALRVEARVKEHQHQKQVLTLKRSICIGGGLLVVIVLWVVLALKSKSASRESAGNPLIYSPSIPVPVAAPVSKTANSVPDTADPVSGPSGTDEPSSDDDTGENDYEEQYNLPEEQQVDAETKKNMSQQDATSTEEPMQNDGSSNSTAPAGDEDTDKGSDAPSPVPVPAGPENTNATGRRLA